MSIPRTISGLLALLVVTSHAAVAADGIIERSHYLANSFNVLAYNIFMRPFPFLDDQSDRGRVLPAKLHGFDVIVFSEAFNDTVRNQLLADLSAEYPHRTSLLDGDKPNGGVIILSRWPITAEAQRLYGGVCVLEDCLADKGVLYARFEKHGQAYHVFASHTQAGDGTERQQTRLRQFGIIKSFIDSRGIAETEPVFIAGDLNVDRHNPSEYAAMLGALDAWYPQPFGHPYTADSTLNRRAEGRQYLDYVLVSNRHLQPISAIIETLIPRSPTPHWRRPQPVGSLSRVRALHVPFSRGHGRCYRAPLIQLKARCGASPDRAAGGRASPHCRRGRRRRCRTVRRSPRRAPVCVPADRRASP